MNSLVLMQYKTSFNFIVRYLIKILKILQPKSKSIRHMNLKL